MSDGKKLINCCLSAEIRQLGPLQTHPSESKLPRNGNKVHLCRRDRLCTTEQLMWKGKLRAAASVLQIRHQRGILGSVMGLARGLTENLNRKMK